MRKSFEVFEKQFMMDYANHMYLAGYPFDLAAAPAYVRAH